MLIISTNPLATFNKPIVALTQRDYNGQHHNQNEANARPKVDVLFITRLWNHQLARLRKAHRPKLLVFWQKLFGGRPKYVRLDVAVAFALFERCRQETADIPIETRRNVSDERYFHAVYVIVEIWRIMNVQRVIEKKTNYKWSIKRKVFAEKSQILEILARTPK